jgi:hypothetical protein
VSLTILAGAATALMLRGSGTNAAPDAAADSRELLGALADESLTRHIRGWAAEAGPDGEQIYCLHDLLVTRLETDGRLRGLVSGVVRRDGAAAATRALRALRERCRCEGYLGAAGWCAQNILGLRRLVSEREKRTLAATSFR